MTTSADSTARIGSVPGSLLPPPGAHETTARATRYGPERHEARPVDFAKIPQRAGDDVLWIDVVGLRDADAIGKIGTTFGLHPLALEDALHVGQLPKAEPYPGNLFVVAQMVEVGDAGLVTEQVSMFLTPNAAITFQERPGDCFEPVRLRIAESRGRIRQYGADYLIYALLDAILDHYFPVMESYGAALDAMEETVLAGRKQVNAAELHRVRRDLRLLRRTIAPTREALARSLRDGAEGLLTAETKVYLRDCLDHATRLLDTVDSYREFATSLVDAIASRSNQRLNEIMKFLAVVSTVFLPLNFIAALYGMNFQTDTSPFNMPELSWRFGYLFSLVVMGAAVVGMLWVLRRRGWLHG